MQPAQSHTNSKQCHWDLKPKLCDSQASQPLCKADFINKQIMNFLHPGLQLNHRIFLDGFAGGGAMLREEH